MTQPTRSSLASLPWRLAAAILALLLALAPAAAQDQVTRPRDARAIQAELDAIKLQFDQVDAALTREGLREADLAGRRSEIDALVDRVEALVAEQKPKADAAAAQLATLGPRPAANAPPESADVARQRAALEAARDEALGPLRFGESLLVRGRLLATAVTDRRRALFTGALFAQSASILSPALWAAVANSLPADLRALDMVVGDWLEQARRDRGIAKRALLILTGLLLLLLFGPLRAILAACDPRRKPGEDPVGLKRTTGAVFTVALGIAVPWLVAYIADKTMEAVGLEHRRFEAVFDTMLYGLVVVAALNALARAYFAPRRPEWRLSVADDRSAATLTRATFYASLVLLLGKMVEQISQAIAAGLPVSVLSRSVFALAFAAIVVAALNRVRRDAERREEDDLGPYVPGAGDISGPLRAVLMLAPAAIVTATLAGFVALGSFLVDQFVSILALAGFAAILVKWVSAAAEAVIRGKSRIEQTLLQSVGLRRRSMEQVAVVVAGAAKVAIVVTAGLLVVASWGVQSDDIYASLRAALFGFRVGDVTISLSALAVAAVVFAAGVAATRAVQRWLDGEFLPRTDLDTGLKNSIRTAIGYVGFAGAAAVAISSLGFSLDRITLVAGALSVGIGFGLQSVVNNFVSGLILLWERSIRVGDWIVVGDAEGVVRRIHIRSTLIETFDRATVIVPNANLVSGVVRNRVHSDRTGRVQVAIGVPRDADPEAVRAVLEGAAKAHPDVLDEPPPRALFKKITDAALDFELTCFVGEVEAGGRIASDLHFTIFRAFTEAGLIKPAAAPTIDMPGLKDLIAEIARERAGAGAKAGAAQ